ncbi:AcrR family transcriptional regulator [Catenuloplanes nepalensis]|uniref:AcrR family transcriptional regulator n=1 Tax=Catenuloplanes nepalensis TaxID=587533 RepID=A0ABT9MMJ4_9ACTN|nr:TetR/AcrR family transcriptional regulator C-terminal domain-containing protein [Catenuloplanes nepalensis]MDP9792659.1 AcrR family transcriptional regulator [Catenuloplanes nepalensis]
MSVEERAPLTRERVLAAAMRVVDAEGIKALTMRRLGAELGVEAMSLYHHLPGKEALLDGLADALIAEIQAEAALRVDAAGWKERLRQTFLAARVVMLRHPWAPGMLGARTTVPARLFAYYDGIVGTMTGGGLSHRLAHRAVHAFGTMALGFTQELFRPEAAGGAADVDAAEADLTAMAAALPHLTAMVAAEAHDAADPVLGWCDGQTEFEFTLALILDGLERGAAGQR